MDTQERIENKLEELGCDPKWRGRYWLIKCPTHEDRAPSAQCFPDGWINCMASCGRYHINKIAPNTVPRNYQSSDISPTYKPKEVEEKIVKGDFTDMWLELDPLPSDMSVKGVPANELNKRGWRWFPGGNGYRPGIFIPYFNIDRTRVPFFQIRHTEGDRRFTFVKDITPIAYGQEMLRKCKRYLCFTEGSRDAIILGMAGVPAVAMPSSASGKILERMCNWCLENRIIPVAVCDRDEAGSKLLESLTVPFLDKRTPVGKDVGDFYAQKGLKAVMDYYKQFRVEDL